MKYIETYNTMQEHDAATFGGWPHTSRILDGDIIIYDGMQEPIVYEPLVIGVNSNGTFVLPAFDVYAGRDSKVTTVAVLMNITGNQTGNTRVYTTTNSEPWKSRTGWGHWIESGKHAPKPIDETWFRQTVNYTSYMNSIYWFVVDAFGNFNIYAGASGDTAPTGSPVYTFNNKQSVASQYQLSTNDIRFLGTGGNDNLVNATVYRINIIDGNATYTGDYIPVVQGNDKYFLNTTTNNKYLIS